MGFLGRLVSSLVLSAALLVGNAATVEMVAQASVGDQDSGYLSGPVVHDGDGGEDGHLTSRICRKATRC